MSRRILCVQLADIGDLVLTTPALAALRESAPHAHIALLTTPHAASVVPSALVDARIPFPKHTFDRPRALLNPRNWSALAELVRALRAGRYDTVIVFHHMSTRFGAMKFAVLSRVTGAAHRVGLQHEAAPFLNAGVPDTGFGSTHQARFWLRLVEAALSIDSRPYTLADRPAHVAVTDADSAWVSRHLPDDSSPLVVMHAGSGGYSTARRWEPVRFAAVAKRLMDTHDAHLVLVGGPSDDSGAVVDALRTLHDITPQQMTDLTGQTTLGQLAAVCRRGDVFIGADSGVMHIAAASGVPVVAIFGPSNDRAWHPWTPTGRHIVVRTGPRCAPCSYVGTGVGLRDGCAARTCMRDVTVDAVSEAASALLSGGAISVQRPMLPPVPAQRDRVQILGVPVDKLTYAAWLDHIGRWIAADDGLHHMCTVNPEFVMIARDNPNFAHILNRADVCLPDGVGLLWAARWQRSPIPSRVTGSDGVWHLAERAARDGWRLFLLGAGEGVAARAADVLRERYPRLEVAGTFSGSPRPEDEDGIVSRVNASGAHVLLVAYGAPQQDEWIARNAHRFSTVRAAMGVGGTFDYIVGDVPMAPAWMRRAGLEWLFRLVRQPWRARRQLRLPAFVWAVLRAGRKST